MYHTGLRISSLDFFCSWIGDVLTWRKNIKLTTCAFFTDLKLQLSVLFKGNTVNAQSLTETTNNQHNFKIGDQKSVHKFKRVNRHSNATLDWVPYSLLQCQYPTHNMSILNTTHWCSTAHTSSTMPKNKATTHGSVVEVYSLFSQNYRDVQAQIRVT